MKILAIDTSSQNCSVVILEDTNLIIEKNNNDEKTHSQKLMPLIDESFNEAALTLNDIDLLVCCQGPGSFTGIRIGISTIKAFSDAKNIPTIGITSLESLAYNISNEGLIASIIDAKNNNVYFGLFELKNSCYNLVEELYSGSIDEILNNIKNYNNRLITFVGNGSEIYKSNILNIFPNAVFADSSQNIQNAISLAKAGYIKSTKNNGNANTLFPIYLKKSQAERALNGEI